MKKEYLITGGTGSLGKTLVKLLSQKPDHVKGIRIFSRDEKKQNDLRNKFKNSPVPISYIIGDVRDYKRLTEAFQRVDIVIHAAALKQVPTAEENPIEFIETNINGTKNVMQACIASNVERALFISTDKAVEPINLYGASKMCAEKIWLKGELYSGGHGTKFAITRYGNVIGSRGSIVDVIKSLDKNKKIPVTNPNMTRFWISLNKVAEFIYEVINTPGIIPGIICIPKMVSCNLGNFIRYTTNTKPSEWDIIGTRPGEKIHECLVNQEEINRTILDTTYYNGFTILPYNHKFSILNTLKQQIFSDERNPLYTTDIQQIKNLVLVVLEED